MESVIRVVIASRVLERSETAWQSRYSKRRLPLEDFAMTSIILI